MKRIFSILFVVALLATAVVLVACNEEPVVHQHTFTTVVTDPVCKTHSAGYTTHTCDCGYSYTTDYVEAHKFNTTILVPTCEYTGYSEHVCSLCGYIKQDTFTAKNPQNHVYVYPDDWEDESKAGTPNVARVVDPTCNDYGYSVYSCIYCNATTVPEETIVPQVLAHDFGAWTSVIFANCVNGGVEKRLCEHCGFEEQRLTSKTDSHVFGDWTVVISDEHINALYEERTCTMCRYKEVGANNETGVLAFELRQNDDGSKYYVVTGYAAGKTTSTVVIPEYLYLDGEKVYVTEIKPQAFMYNANISIVYIPTSITRIGAFAFSGCTKLVQITYAGTAEQWNAINKVEGWDYQTHEYKVVTK